MTVMEQVASPAPNLAAPKPPERPMSLWRFVRTLRENSLATYSVESYSADIIATKLLWRRTFFLNEPSGIKHVLLDNAANYHKTEIARRLLEPGLGRGLLTSEDETWRAHRRIMAPSFDHRSIVAYSPIMTEIAEQLVGKWNAMPADAEIDVAAEMMHATLHIISRTMFSSDSDDIVDVVERGVERYQDEIRPTLFDLLELPIWLSRLFNGHRPEAVLVEFDRAIDRMLKERERISERQPKDLLGRLMAARDEETGGGMTAQEVRNQVVTIFMAGHETTAVALTWTWYLLSQHPAIEAKLHTELQEVLGGRSPRHEDLQKLPYTRMVIEESMRLYPPAHTLSREAMGEDEVLGHRIPAHSTVLIVPWLLHRNPKLWEQPNRFDPERFTPERVAARPRFSYIPFGAGPRICIGAAFAMAEAMLILATVAQRYRLHLKPGHPVEPLGLITLRSRYGMKMLLERRH